MKEIRISVVALVCLDLLIHVNIMIWSYKVRFVNSSLMSAGGGGRYLAAVVDRTTVIARQFSLIRGDRKFLCFSI